MLNLTSAPIALPVINVNLSTSSSFGILLYSHVPFISLFPFSYLFFFTCVSLNSLLSSPFVHFLSFIYPSSPSSFSIPFSLSRFSFLVFFSFSFPALNCLSCTIFPNCLLLFSFLVFSFLSFLALNFFILYHFPSPLSPSFTL